VTVEEERLVRLAMAVLKGKIAELGLECQVHVTVEGRILGA
jgi:hypothetical protein